MDWVERRAAQGAAIASTIDRTWTHLGIAVSHAVTSYNEHFGTESQAYAHSQYPDIISAYRENRKTRTKVAGLKITREASSVDITYDNASHAPVRFAAIHDGQAVVMQHDGATVDVERMSEISLTPILF